MVELPPVAVDGMYSAVAEFRWKHPELREPRLTWEGMRRLLARESMLVTSVPLVRPAKSLPCEGVAVMLLDNSCRARHL